MLAGRDDILHVHVVGAKNVQNGEPRADALVEPDDLVDAGARSSVDVFHPSMRTTVQRPHHAKRRLHAAAVEMLDELLERQFHPEGTRFVDETTPARERHDPDDPAFVVRIAVGCDEADGRTEISERLPELRDVGVETLQQFARRRNPVVDERERATCEYRVRDEKAATRTGFAHAVDELVETRFGGRCHQ